MIFNPLAVYLISKYDWHVEISVMSLILLLILVPFSFFLFESKKLKIPSFETNQKETIVEGMDIKDIVKSRVFKFLLIIIALMGFGITAITVNMNPHLIDKGHTIEFTSWISGGYMLFLAISKIFLGRAFDKKGIKFATITCIFALLISDIAMIKSHILFSALILMVISAYATAYNSICFSPYINTLFGSKEYSATYSYLQGAYGFASMIAPVFMGFSYSRNDSYTMGLYFMLIFIFMTFIITFRELPKKEV